VPVTLGLNPGWLWATLACAGEFGDPLVRRERRQRHGCNPRYPRSLFDEIQDVKVTKDMLDLAKHIVNQKSGRFEPDKFEDHYENALVELINQKRAGNPRRRLPCLCRCSSRLSLSLLPRSQTLTSW
jgi:hypothetical protein